MTQYAQGTQVSVEKSEIEVRRLLQKYGASQFSSGWDQEHAHVDFTIKTRQVRFVLLLPKRDERRFQFDARGKRRTPDRASAEWEQGCRQAWRALVLVLKAKLEAVESKIATFEQEFLAHIVLPGGRTIGEYVLPQLDAITSGRARLLPQNAGPSDDDVEAAEIIVHPRQ